MMGRKNPYGDDVRTLKPEFVGLNELGEHSDPLGVFGPVEKRRDLFGQEIEIQLPRAPDQAVLQVRRASVLPHKGLLFSGCASD